MWQSYSIHLNSLTKFSTISRSSKMKDILPQTISQMITKTVTISTRIVASCEKKKGISFWVWRKVNGNCDKYVTRISQCRESYSRTNTMVRRNKGINKSRNSSSKIDHLSKVIWVRKIIAEFIRPICSTIIRNQSLWWTLIEVSNSRGLYWQNLIYVR